MSERHSLIAFLGTLLTIVLLAGAASLAVNKGRNESAYTAAIVGLIGVIGTFKPRTGGMSEENEGKIVDKLPPPTGDAKKSEDDGS